MAHAHVRSRSQFLRHARRAVLPPGRDCGGVRAAKGRASSRRARARWLNRSSAIAASSTEPSHASAPRLRTLEKRRFTRTPAWATASGNTRSGSHTTGEGTRPTGCPSRFGRTSRSSGPPSGRCRPKRRAICRRRSATTDTAARIPLFARADSNGCAAGSVLEEAVLQGLLELIERDAVALWWYNRLRRPAVDLESADDRIRLGAHASLRRASARPLGARRHERLRSAYLCCDIEAGGQGRRGHHLRFRRTSRPARRSGTGVDGAEPVVGGSPDRDRPGVDPYLPREARRPCVGGARSEPPTPAT